MRVRDLIAQLSECDLDSEIILQIDSEGNGYKRCYGVDKNWVFYKDNYIFLLNWSLEESGLSKEEYDKMFKKPRIVILYPNE
jgi:hypothetical protein